MPSEWRSIAVYRSYDIDEFDRICAGLIPQQMEDKWFIFYESPWLYLHRSWTGFCLFKVRFEPTEEGVRIAEVWVNRDASQYTQTDDRRDAELLAILLDSRANRDTQSQMLRYIAILRQLEATG